MKVAWKIIIRGRYRLFSDVSNDKLTNLNKLVDVVALFPVYTRTNQGYNISLVMKRIPAMKDFDDGRRLGADLGSFLLVSAAFCGRINQRPVEWNRCFILRGFGSKAGPRTSGRSGKPMVASAFPRGSFLFFCWGFLSAGFTGKSL